MGNEVRLGHEKNINEAPGYPFNLHARFTRCFVAGRRIVFGKWLSKILNHGPLSIDASGSAANELLRQIIEDDSPRFVSRFGAIEMEAALRGLDVQSRASILKKILRISYGEGGAFWWDNSIRARMLWNAGFFPPTDEALNAFSNLVCRDVSQIDVLVSWLPGERQFRRYYNKELKAIPFIDYEPFWHDQPWSSSLKGMKVLVVHPFADTIKSQYARRGLLFRNQNTLPDFELIMYRTISSFAGNGVAFKSWFCALDKMCNDISQIDFDIALIGCGAYGMSIGAFIKRELRRKAMHLGGMTQLLFGIKGGRWDRDPKYSQGLYNEYWVRPFDSDKVKHTDTIEGGCYW